MSETVISVAMATLNGGAYLAEQLASLAAQSRTPDELVICDDGSTDDTIAVIEQFQRSAAFPVRLHRNSERLGYSLNFSRAANLCTGNLILFCDQDDRWLADKLAIVAGIADRHPDKQLFVNDEIIATETLMPTGATAFGNARKLNCDDSDLVAGCCTAVRKEMLALLLPFPPIMAYDKWTATMADLLGVKLLIERPLQLYRRHKDNATTSVMAFAAPTILQAFRHHGLSDPRAAWDGEIEHFDCFEHRLRSRQTEAERLVGADALDAALALIARRRQWLETRRALVDLPRVRRLPQVAHLLRSGFYEPQRGILSAIRDLVRR